MFDLAKSSRDVDLLGETRVPPQEAQFARPIDEVEGVDLIIDPDGIRTIGFGTRSVPLETSFDEGVVALGFCARLGVHMEDAGDATAGEEVNVFDIFGAHNVLPFGADDAWLHGTVPDFESQLNRKFAEFGEPFWRHDDVACRIRVVGYGV